jgi:hypothetical protein
MGIAKFQFEYGVDVWKNAWKSVCSYLRERARIEGFDL